MTAQWLHFVIEVFQKQASAGLPTSRAKDAFSVNQPTKQTNKQMLQGGPLPFTTRVITPLI